MVVKRFRVKFFGIVQGVGFRPFIYREACSIDLKGFVKNVSDCVIVEIEGSQEKIELFLKRVRSNSPPLSKIEKIEKEEIFINNDKNFQILNSVKTLESKIHIPPDIATCKECLNELFDEKDRRYFYPFINCTNCGPRFTIIKDIPYDRKNTSMDVFNMCETCSNEYKNPLDRRFHAEPIACHRCGPEIKLISNKGTEIVSWKQKSTKSGVVKEIINKVIKLLKQGDIIAIKGLGGFHLAVDATNFNAVKKLRSRKSRNFKAFALMVKDIEKIKKIAFIDKREEEILLSPQSPIVLLKKRKNEIIAKNIAPGLDNYGIMVPYTPLHHLIFSNLDYLVMTSGNFSDEPICIKNREVFERLANIADYFLVHNREILVRCDDSICAVYNETPVIFRRARGFAPSPIKLSKKYNTVLALGGYLKNTVCVLKDNFAFLGPHCGDLETPLSRNFFYENIALMQRITETEPDIIAVDMNPAYYSTRFAFDNFKHKKIVKVQHHHAHIVSCISENHISEKVIGIALDGTGYGTDGTVWGGEILIADEKDFKRAGYIKNFLLMGGDISVYEIWRIAVSLLIESFQDKWLIFAEKLNIFPEKIKNREIFYKIWQNKINSINTSSAGRLFDAIAAVLLNKKYVEYEAEAAINLEAFSTFKDFKILPYKIENNIIDFILTFKSVVERVVNGEDRNFLARSFHFTVIDAFVKVAKNIREINGLNKVVLSGGCFQNRILLENFFNLLKKEDFEVFYHLKVPCNDGGISLGQAVIAANKVK